MNNSKQIKLNVRLYFKFFFKLLMARFGLAQKANFHIPMWKFLNELEPVIYLDFPQNYGIYLAKLSGFNNKDLICSINRLKWHSFHKVNVCDGYFKSRCIVFLFFKSSGIFTPLFLMSSLLERFPWNRDPWNKGKNQ